MTPPVRSAARAGRPAGFTLVELLVVVALIGLLVALLLPNLAAALARGRRVQCANNIRQLAAANTQYGDDRGYYAAAAEDIHAGNLRRWHGARARAGAPFEGRHGPLAPYLGASDGLIRRCPAFTAFKRHQPDANTFEASCGGFGYNDRGVGSQAYRFGYSPRGSAHGMKPGMIAAPAATAMFADTAFPQPYGPRPQYLIEYSFAEAYHFVEGDPPAESARHASPSVHFRHDGRASVAWCDGHVSSEILEQRASEAFTRFGIGWFGPPDNSLFDPY